MAVLETDIKFYKSSVITDTGINGNRKGYEEVISAVKNNLFPRVTTAERTAGVTRYRKEFFTNVNAANETAYGVLLNIIKPSNGGDRYYIAPGTQTDTQADLAAPKEWLGAGALNADIAAAATQLTVLFEAADYAIPNDRYLNIKDTANIEWIKTANNVFTAEVSGAGDGTNTAPALTALANTPILAGSVTIHSTAGAAAKSVTDDGAGVLSGDGTGTIDYETGAIAVTWATAPDASTNITSDYTERCYSWAGNVATIKLKSGVANAYAAADTNVGMCIEAGDIVANHSVPVVSSTAGTFDEAGNPIVDNNPAAVEDDWTITFTSGTAFTCSGANEGSAGTGAIGADFSPVNPNTGTAYFTISSLSWGGSWSSGDTLSFTTHPAAYPLWLKEIVPVNTPRELNNETDLEWYVE